MIPPAMQTNGALTQASRAPHCSHALGDEADGGQCTCQTPWPAEHWALMFAAVAERLRCALALPRRPMPEFCQIVLECVEALEILQAALALEQSAPVWEGQLLADPARRGQQA